MSNHTKKLIQITHKQLPEIRKKQWEKQDKKCPVLDCKIDLSDAVLDHKHKRKNDPIGVNCDGLLRGVLHREVNTVEGKIARLYKRYGLSKLISLPDLLRRLASYIESPPMEHKYIHPNESEKPQQLGKRNYNKIKKYYFEIYPKRNKMPQYPKSGRLTKEFKQILKDVEKHIKQKETKNEN